MKIDLDLIEKMVAAGASGSVVLAYLRDLDQKQAPKRAKERTRKNAENARKRPGKEAEKQRQTVDDSPRARLFREGSGILAALGRTDRGSRGLLSQWLKLTNDDAQLVMATLQRARDLGVADVAGWVLTTLNGKVKNGAGHRSLAAAGDDLIARLGGGEREGGPVIEHEPG